MGSISDFAPNDKPAVAFLGPAGSYSHQAAKASLPEQLYDHVPADSISDVFALVQRGAVSRGVVPVENSTHGAVLPTLDGLADRHGSYPDVRVTGDVFLPIHHCLVGRKPPAPPPSSASEPAPSEDTSHTTAAQALQHIRRIYSHPQAFGQTRGFIGGVLRHGGGGGVETIDVASTSRAAALAAEDATGRSAAVASELAAGLHGLEVLARNIEDRADNTTRFFVLRKESHPSGGSAAQNGCVTVGRSEKLGWQRNPKNGEGREGGEARERMLVSFTVPRAKPSALFDVLDSFRRQGIGCTNINSLPSWVQPFQYLFLVELGGSKLQDADEKMHAGLCEVNKVVCNWRWLGSWETTGNCN